MDNGFPPVPDNSPDRYLELIDAERKAEFKGEAFLCINREKDVWQRLATIPIDMLKRVAVECLTTRLQKLQPNPPFVVPRERHLPRE